MSFLRAVGFSSGPNPRRAEAGDLVGAAENIKAGAIVTIGAGTWTGAAIASGIITRTGPTAGYTDTIDTAQNILAALAGSANLADVAPGSSFRLLFINTVAFAMTFAADANVSVTVGTDGSGVVNCAASMVREYLLTILNATPQFTINCGTTNGNKIITFVLPPNMVSLPLGQADNPQGITVTPGMIVSGTGITAGTKVVGVTQGQGGVTGVTTDTNSTATSVAGGVSLTFSPNIKIDGLFRSGAL